MTFRLIFMSVALKITSLFWGYLSNKSSFKKIFEGEMFITTLYTTLLQIFCELLLNSKVIPKHITGPDDTCEGDLGYNQE